MIQSSVPRRWTVPKTRRLASARSRGVEVLGVAVQRAIGVGALLLDATQDRQRGPSGGAGGHPPRLGEEPRWTLFRAANTVACWTMAVSVPAAPAFSLRAVEKSFGGRMVLDGLDFEVGSRARVGLVGANGAGKSTILRLLAGHEEPDAGTLTIRKGATVAFLPQLVRATGAARWTPSATRCRPPPPCTTSWPTSRPRWPTRHWPATSAHDAAARAPDAAGRGSSARTPSTATRCGCCATSASTTRCSSARRAPCRAASASSSRSPRAWSASPTCCCSTSPRRTSTWPAARCWRSSSRAPTARWSSSPTTATCSTRSSRRSPSSTTAACGCGPAATAPTPSRASSSSCASSRSTRPAEGDRAHGGGDPQFKDWARRTLDERFATRARNMQRRIDRIDQVDRPVFERRKMALELRSSARGGERVVELRDVEFDPVLTGRRPDGHARRARSGSSAPTARARPCCCKLLAASWR